jgi:hypothetical protein
VLKDLGKPIPRRSADPVLRAKYLDYCSARVAEALLDLSADDMYLLAQEVAGDTREPGQDMPPFSTIVRLATERLTRDLSLPDFPDWVRDYERDPERFEREMIGLWEADLKTLDQSVN